MLTVFGIVVAVVFGVVVGRTLCVEKKRFGLKEAEAAVLYADRAVAAVAPMLPDEAARAGVKKATVQAMLGSVVGLGYELAVAKDAAKLGGELADLNDTATDQIDANRSQISELEVANTDLLADIAKNNVRSTEVRELASLFLGA